MKCQRNLVQSKISTPEKGLSETDLINLPEEDFKIKIINMLLEVQKNIQELRNKFRTEIQSLKSTMVKFKSRLDKVEKMINEIEIREEKYKEAEAK